MFNNFREASDYAKNIAQQGAKVSLRRCDNGFEVLSNSANEQSSGSFTQQVSASIPRESDDRPESTVEFCGWHGSKDLFISTPNEEIVKALRQFHQICCNEPASPEQIIAWRNCLEVLKPAIESLVAPVHIVFEYVLPREQGRRPDVVLLFREQVVVLEFKDYHCAGAAHIDQAQAYSRDLHDYHSGCHGKSIISLLVLTRAGSLVEQHGEVTALGQNSLHNYLEDLCEGIEADVDVDWFIKGEYAPLPTLISSAQLLFNNQPLPQIRKAASAGIPATVDLLHELANRTANDGVNRLVLVTGVPGSGKTLVGLQFVYDASTRPTYDAVFLSGNGPLVKVLQYTLGSRIFVQSIHGFLKQYGGGASQIPSESVWFYDEAQRAWDDATSMSKRGPHSVSEPKDLVQMAGRSSKGVVIIGLVGEGQEIHIGEEAGIGQWADAVEKSDQIWEVFCPQHTASPFEKLGSLQTDERLNLDHSLRTHRANHLQQWVEQLLNGELADASKLSTHLFDDGYPIYVTREIRSAKRHVKEKYSGFGEKRYGLLASSKARNVARHGIRNGYGSVKDIGAWFADPPVSSNSCCQLNETATEFSCQGLELDMPVVAWGNDLIWNSGENRWHKFEERSAARNPDKLRKNSYRVLLTRGRDGLVIFIPADVEMNDTHQALRRAGAREFRM